MMKISNPVLLLIITPKKILAFKYQFPKKGITSINSNKFIYSFMSQRAEYHFKTGSLFTKNKVTQKNLILFDWLGF